MDWSPSIELLESFVTVMSKDQYRRLELIAQGKAEPSSFTEKEIKALEKKLKKQIGKLK